MLLDLALEADALPVDFLAVDLGLGDFERALPDVAFFALEREDVERADLLVRDVPAFLLEADLLDVDFDDLLPEPLFDEEPDFDFFELDEVEPELDVFARVDDLRDPDDLFAAGILFLRYLRKKFAELQLAGCNQYAAAIGLRLCIVDYTPRSETMHLIGVQLENCPHRAHGPSLQS